MNYGYIRVSTDKQTVENQRFEIERFCAKNGMDIDQWIEETISGTKEPEKRKLGGVLKKLKKDDILICAELSRLGRSLLMIMAILNQCMKKEVQVWTIKDNYRLGSDISSKVLAFAFGLSAEIERNLISQRTKEALARKRAEGVVLGRPKGRKSSRVKLTGQEEKIRVLLSCKLSKSKIAKILGVHRSTLAAFLSRPERIIEQGKEFERDPSTLENHNNKSVMEDKSWNPSRASEGADIDCRGADKERSTVFEREAD